MLIRLPWLISRRRLLIALLLDGGLFLLVYAVAFRQRFSGWPQLNVPLICLLCFWLISSYVIGRYYDKDELRSAVVIKQFVRTLICLLISVGLFLGWLWLTSSPRILEISRSFMLPVLFVFAIGSGLSQYGFNYALSAQSRSPGLWLVLGSTAFFRQLQQSIVWSRFNVILQFVDHNDSAWSDCFQVAADGLVVECFSKFSSEEINSLVNFQANGLMVVDSVAWSEHVLQRFPPALLQAEDLLRSRFTAPRASMFLRFKRVGDVVVSALLLLLFLPLMLSAALLISFEDGGPVLYSQLRSGLDAKPFRVWKLRSMRMNSEVHGPQWSSHGDPRITRIGRLLRVARIDELPQLFSVLCGKMSLIGPRPERPVIELELERQIPYYRLRHLTRPGMSGWAQVNYPYGASLQDSENKLSYDLYYLRNSSFWLDLLILFKTMRLVFNFKGALPVLDAAQSEDQKCSIYRQWE